jgi:hypothetical protein
VRRNDMGPFLCIASNGVLPIVSKRILLNVNCEFVRIAFVRITFVRIAFV